MNVFEPFIRDMMIQAGFHPTQIQDELVDDALEVFMDRLVTEITIKLNDDDKVIFLELLENNNYNLNPAFEFIMIKIDNYQDFLEDIMDNFAKEYIESFGK